MLSSSKFLIFNNLPSVTPNDLKLWLINATDNENVLDYFGKNKTKGVVSNLPTERGSWIVAGLDEEERLAVFRSSREAVLVELSN